MPSASASYVAAMEAVLDLYEEPTDPHRPRVCLDEMPYQLRQAAMDPLAMEPGHPRREDYAYDPLAMVNCFGLFCPERGWRQVNVTVQRTTQDFAYQLKALVEEYFPEATVIRLITDNLNTHGPHALYATLPPEDARRIARKLEWHYTPVHGSWLNMVEIELGLLKRRCLDQRLSSLAAVQQEAAAWVAERNAAGVTVDWRFTTPMARQTLRRLYPALPEA